MFQWLFNLLYEATPAKFFSDYDISESVQRLKNKTVPTRFHSMFHEAAVGCVFRSDVRLHRSLRFDDGGFKPRFFGSFRFENERVVVRCLEFLYQSL